MKIVVFGGGGLIGAPLVQLLRNRGHEVLPASRASGVDAVTGAGLSDALTQAQVVVDVMNSPSFADADVLAFFQATSLNILAAEAVAGVGHHVALSVIGCDRLPDSGYMRAKNAQESLIRSAGVPYTILRATQFFEFAGAIGGSGAEGDAIRLPNAMMQPVAAADVSAALAEIALSRPINGILEVAGPEPIRMDELVRRFLSATGDAREVISDPQAHYFGTALDDRSLTPDDIPRLGATRYDDWLSHSLVAH